MLFYKNSSWHLIKLQFYIVNTKLSNYFFTLHKKVKYKTGKSLQAIPWLNSQRNNSFSWLLLFYFLLLFTLWFFNRFYTFLYFIHSLFYFFHMNLFPVLFVTQCFINYISKIISNLVTYSNSYLKIILTFSTVGNYFSIFSNT